jgi:hypothetical protein
VDFKANSPEFATDSFTLVFYTAVGGDKRTYSLDTGIIKSGVFKKMDWKRQS